MLFYIVFESTNIFRAEHHNRINYFFYSFSYHCYRCYFLVYLAKAEQSITYTINDLKNLRNFVSAKPTWCIWIIAAAFFLCSTGTSKLAAQTNSTAATVNNPATILVKGIVKDDLGMPIPAIKIIDIATNVIAETNMDGNFEIATVTGNNLELYFNNVVIQTVKVTSINKLEIILPSATIDQYTTLAGLATQNKVAANNKRIKFSLPDPNFFSSALQAVINTLR